MNNPLISVILPTYNGSRYISSAIRSVLSQDYDNIELIVINDASTDPKVETVILKFQKKDARIRYIKNEMNLERSASKNKGVQEAKGKFVAFIDDDDVWQDINKLVKQANILSKNPSIGMVGTCAETMDENNTTTGKILVKTDDRTIRSSILLTNQFIHSSVLICKNSFLQTGGFNETMSLCEDYDLWLRIGLHSGFANIPDLSTKYMIRNSNTTAKNMLHMKTISLILVWKYRKAYPNIFLAIIARLATFFLPIRLIAKVRGYF